MAMDLSFEAERVLLAEERVVRRRTVGVSEQCDLKCEAISVEVDLKDMLPARETKNEEEARE